MKLHASQSKYLLLPIFCLVSNLLAAQALESRYIPAAFPDRIILNATTEPATTAAFNWRTNDTTEVNYLEIAPAEADPRFVKKAKRYTATSSKLEVEGTPPSIYHSIKVENLVPKTKYAYRVGSGDYWSEWFHFNTADNDASKFQFLYYGDVQVNMRSLWSRVAREAFQKAPDARLAIYAGDLINRANRDVEWGEFFDAGGFIHAMIPNFPTPGNHDHYDNEQKENTISKFWRAQFNLPLNGPEGLEETVYYADIQGIRFISLNSDMVEENDGHMASQAKWLEEILSKNPQKWTVVTFHHPIFSPKQTRDNKRMRETFKPIFDKYKVDLVLQGHDHTYARGMAKIPMNGKSKSGTMYVVSVSGPKMTDSHVEKAGWMDRKAIYTQLFHVIEVENDKLNFKTYTAVGELYDEFDLKKQKGKTNLLIDKTPAGVAER